MSDENTARASAIARERGLDCVSVETLEIVEKTLQDEGTYSRSIEDFCLFLINLHREAVTKNLSRSGRKRHLRLVNAKLVQIRDRIGVVC
jgi:hypothetical protein